MIFLIELEVMRQVEKRERRRRIGADDDGLAYFHVGSFYLRMGVLVFGSASVIQHCMRGFVEFPEWTWIKEPLIAVYIMLQMVLIFNFSIVSAERKLLTRELLKF